MRYRIKEYGVSIDSSTLGITIKNVPQEVYDAITTTGGGTGYVTSESLRLIEESIRLITDETRAGYIVCSTGQKGVLSSAVKIVASNVNNWITLNFSKSALITAANGDVKDLAAIDAIASTDQFTIERDWGDEPTGLSGGDDAHNLASFFNITEATEYTALTPAEAIAIARDCQYNVMGTDWPIPTWLPTGVTEAQVESAAEGLGIPYHEPTQTQTA